MGLFSANRDTDTEKDKPQPKRRGPLPALIALLLFAVILFPGFFLVTVVATVIHEYRRVRARWYLLWSAVAVIIATIAAGGMTGWIGWNLAQVGLIFSRFFPDNPDGARTALSVAAGFSGNLIAAVVAETIAAAPLGLLIAALIIRYRRLARTQRGQMEGETHSNERPIGILDRARGQRERKKIAAGYYLQNQPAEDPADDKDIDVQVAAQQGEGSSTERRPEVPLPEVPLPPVSEATAEPPLPAQPVNPADRFARPTPALPQTPQPAATPPSSAQRPTQPPSIPDDLPPRKVHL